MGEAKEGTYPVGFFPDTEDGRAEVGIGVVWTVEDADRSLAEVGVDVIVPGGLGEEVTGVFEIEERR